MLLLLLKKKQIEKLKYFSNTKFIVLNNKINNKRIWVVVRSMTISGDAR